MINHISKEEAEKLYKSASIHLTAGANVRNITNYTRIEQPKQQIDYTKIVAGIKSKGSK